MRILYISDAILNPSTGLYWSVPNQINSQSEFDEVYWLNANQQSCEYWSKFKFYHIGNNLQDAESPFDKPDLIVFEGFYQDVRKIYKQVRKLKIPYIVIPRCSLTKEAQKIKPWKKAVANLLFFKRFTRNAIAIHYLTNNEKLTSGPKWNKRSIVIPNGVVNVSELQWKSKAYEGKSHLRGTFIGRISITHKGLDMLVEAVSLLKEKMEVHCCVIDIYGPPDTPKDLEKLNSLISKQGISHLIKVHPASVSGKDKEKVLLESDFFVLTSRLEGHPMGLIEALSYGLPVVVTEGTNMKHEIDKYMCGVTSENSVQGIKTALSDMLDCSPYILTIKSENAIKLAHEYSWRKIAANTHKLYTELLHNK